MKKKIRELTIDEILKYCINRSSNRCDKPKCPFIGSFGLCPLHDLSEKYLDKEVEVDEI